MKTLLLTFVLIVGIGVLAADFTGKCTSVVSGDILLVQKEGKEVQIKLQGIACPEKGQDFNAESLDFMKSLALDKDLEIKERGLDREGRTVGEVLLEGKNLSAELLKNGLAWCAKNNSNYELANLEKASKQGKVGLWSKPNPIPPWEYCKPQNANGEATAKVPVNAFDCKYQGKPLSKAQFDRLFKYYKSKLFYDKNGDCYDPSSRETLSDDISPITSDKLAEYLNRGGKLYILKEVGVQAQKCQDCGGAGKITNRNYNRNRIDSKEYITCPTCKGSGNIPQKPQLQQKELSFQAIDSLQCNDNLSDPTPTAMLQQPIKEEVHPAPVGQEIRPTETEINGAFGKKLGETYEPSTEEAKMPRTILFKPAQEMPAPFSELIDFSISITPTSHKIYAINATTNYKKMADAKYLLSNLKRVIESKYGSMDIDNSSPYTYYCARGNKGKPFSFALDGKQMILLSLSLNRDSLPSVALSYSDVDLQKQAEAETKALDIQRTKGVDF